MQIQIGPYEFEVAEPYQPGHPLSPIEAKVLNSLRSVRVRNILYKKLKKIAVDGELLEPEVLLAFADEVARLDAEFKFVPHKALRIKRGTLQAEIEEVARERATDETDEAEMAALSSRQEVIEEATRRFVARQEIAKNSLEELLG